MSRPLVVDMRNFFPGTPQRFREIPELTLFSNGVLMHTESKVKCPIFLDPKGYSWTVVKLPEVLCSNNVDWDVLPLSRLLAMTFLGLPKSNDVTVFVDGNRCNCQANNLSWFPKGNKYPGQTFPPRPTVRLQLDPKNTGLEQYVRSLGLATYPSTVTLRQGWLNNTTVEFRAFSEKDEVLHQLWSEQKYPQDPDGLLKITGFNPKWSLQSKTEIPVDGLLLPNVKKAPKLTRTAADSTEANASKKIRLD